MKTLAKCAKTDCATGICLFPHSASEDPAMGCGCYQSGPDISHPGWCFADLTLGSCAYCRRLDDPAMYCCDPTDE